MDSDRSSICFKTGRMQNTFKNQRVNLSFQCYYQLAITKEKERIDFLKALGETYLDFFNSFA